MFFDIFARSLRTSLRTNNASVIYIQWRNRRGGLLLKPKTGPHLDCI